MDHDRATALHEAATLLRLLTDNVRDVLFRIRLGPPPAYDYVSPAVEAMSGYPPGDFYRDADLGRRILHPDDQIGADLLDATRDGAAVRWIHRDGHIVHVEPRAILVRDEMGRPVAVEGSLRDVSARVQAEEALRESEARLRSVFAAMAEGVLVFDAEGRIVDCNASAERVLGWTRDVMLGRLSTEDWRAVHEDGTAFTQAEYPVNRTLLGGEPTRDVLMGLVRSDGSIGWVSLSSEPLRRAGEARPHGVLVSCTDVTAERRAWVEVRRREAQLRLAMECAGHDFWELDLASSELKVGTVNPRMVPTRPQDEKAWWELVHPEDRKRALAELEDHVAGRTPAYLSEFRMRGADGGWRWMQHSGRAVQRDERGRATRLAGTVTDITEFRQLQERLRDADRLAAVGTLAAVVAHEVNNPLAYVMANLTAASEGLAGLAGGAGGDPAQAERAIEVRQALREAMDGAERVRGIVRGLRQFAQPSRGEERGPVDLRAEIEAAVGIARNEIAHRARLEVALPERLPAVRGAPRELGQVFVNLLVNAAQAIPEGHVQEHEVRIAARVDGPRVVVEVSDTGTGIDPADLPRVFDPFFTTKPGGGGTGLGLSVCRGIITSLGGTIDVESTPGKGSTFRVALPTEPERPATAPTPAAAAPQPGRRGRVLVIDDESLVARSLARLLAAHEVTVLTSAPEALARAAAGERWDVVLCDLMMPEMDGMELERRLTVEAPDLVPRIVYLTGGAFTDRSREFLAGGRPHLEKPVAPAVLRAKVAERVAAVLGG